MVCLESHRGSHSSCHGRINTSPVWSLPCPTGFRAFVLSLCCQKVVRALGELVWVCMSLDESQWFAKNGVFTASDRSMLKSDVTDKTWILTSRISNVVKNLKNHHGWIRESYDHRSESKNVEDRPVILFFLMLKRGCINMSIPIGSMVLLYMLTWIPSIYPSHVSINKPAPWIRHGIYIWAPALCVDSNGFTQFTTMNLSIQTAVKTQRFFTPWRSKAQRICRGWTRKRSTLW